MERGDFQILKDFAERAVVAWESLAQDPVVHVETLPPVCPNCETMNPMVSVKETEGQGPLAEIVIKATCLSCNREFIAVPIQMEMAQTISEAAELLAERNAQRGLNGGTDQGT